MPAPLAYHPELERRARWLPRGVARRWTIPLLKRLDRLTAWLPSTGERVELDGCSVFVHRPRVESPKPRPALLWMHGGGLLFGDARQDSAFLRRIVDELGIVAASVQYRCAPEHPFPTPLYDCAQAFDWLATHPDVDRAHIMVGGASAGGGLAAALCQLLRDRAGHQPCFQLLVYPMLDDRSSDGTSPIDDSLRVWDRASNALGWGAYLRGHDRAAPPGLCVPARTDDLSGLPPAWVGVGTLDLFHDEDVEYARRLVEAHVPVTLKLVEGAYHGFDQIDARAPVSRRFRGAQIGALAASLSQ